GITRRRGSMRRSPHWGQDEPDARAHCMPLPAATPRRFSSSTTGNRVAHANQLREGRMNSRSRLWLALGAIGLPLLVEAVGGCSFKSPAAAPVVDNAYTCGCLCGADPRRGSFQIAVNSDDAEQNGAVVDLGGNDLDIGSQTVGLRFR